MSSNTNASILRGVSNKDQRQLLRKCIKVGARLSISGGNHVRVDGPTGHVHCSLTGNCKKQILVKEFRSIGLQI